MICKCTLCRIETLDQHYHPMLQPLLPNAKQPMVCAEKTGVDNKLLLQNLPLSLSPPKCPPSLKCNGNCYQAPSNWKQSNDCKRAGIVMYNSVTDKFLLVQSYGKLWGFPKGHMELGEEVRNAAARELKEETGIVISTKDLCEFICIHNNALYYIINTENEHGSLSESDSREISGVMWINRNCLVDLAMSYKLQLNSHCKYILNNKFDFGLT